MFISEIDNNSKSLSQFALFNLGFRPFFLGASIFSIISVLLWMGIFVWQIPLQIKGINVYQWHAHEMIYGYSVAVIAGFLLTAVKNWTGKQTLHGFWLLGLFIFWLTARVLFLFGTSFIFIAAIFDMLFMLCLIIAIAYPMYKSKQWKQTGILAKLILLAVGNYLFYLGAINNTEQEIYWGNYGGLLLIIGLILTLGRRVIPFFIERGVTYPVQLVNYKLIDRISLILFVIFFVSFLFIDDKQFYSYSALALFIVTTFRLIGWHTAGIWDNPLLWILFIAVVFIDIGFLLIAASDLINIPIRLAIHAFSYGGIGIITLGMMSRVSLGHTGRNVQVTPAGIPTSFILLIMGATCRVLLPIIDMNHYLVWIIISQILWAVAFLIFAIVFIPILTKPRVDRQFG